MLTKLKKILTDKIPQFAESTSTAKKGTIDKDKQASSNFNDIPIFNIRWYPSGKSCFKSSNNNGKIDNPPPLMVRKAEWRR